MKLWLYRLGTFLGLTALAYGQVTTRFTYDYTGRRIEKVTSGVRTNTLLDGAYEVVSGPTPSRTKYIYAPGGLVASITTGQRRYLHGNHLGSVSVVTDGGGTEIVRYLYTPYGELIRAHSPGPDVSRHKFTGQEEDDETGLQYYIARYREPRTTLWLSADTVVPPRQDILSHNRFTYVRCNPLRYLDPKGHKEESWEDVRKQVMDYTRTEEIPSNAGELYNRIGDAKHDAMVLKVVNALLSGKKQAGIASSLQARLNNALEVLTELRNDLDVPHSSTSILLRDAQRYLYGRAGVVRFSVAKGIPVSVVRSLAEEYDFQYNLEKVQAAREGTLDLMRANRALPHSAVGGSHWFQLGLQHYDTWDAQNYNQDIRPRLLNSPPDPIRAIELHYSQRERLANESPSIFYRSPDSK